MPLVVVIALKDLRQRLRDRSALLMSVVAPLLLGCQTVANGCGGQRVRGADHHRLDRM